ncbi:LytTR family DNA-binding domain-containing protein [Paucibacter sp. B2R-40]|uniref:LytR/AlgR family response regulator transcription factor n=1 Tax=Paucibacter sp. B2R-40 TaxID=2893554 RepID=UPI0021E4BF3B|nr:LytTR family DNA-binding domain-containing protein [Paucibacter sp. B2R-40]MCV2355549.1 LytTR family DNA-binding domain-containing protein [Paucibacter sp. B2R-40]
MTRALIADDEPHLAQYLKQQLADCWPELEIVAVARNGIEAAEQINALQPDIAFLDIQMPGLTGLEVAQGIEGGTRVVFVTAYDEYALEAFDAAAIDYLLKPLKTERLLTCLARLKGALAQPQAAETARLAEALQRLLPSAAAAPRLRFIRAGSADLMHQVAVQDVLFFHADDKYTVVKTAQAEHLIRTTITDLVAQLDPEQFWQVHRSTLINLAHLAGTRRDEMSRLFVRIKGHAQELPVSRAYVHLFKSM